MITLACSAAAMSSKRHVLMVPPCSTLRSACRLPLATASTTDLFGAVSHKQPCRQGVGRRRIDTIFSGRQRIEEPRDAFLAALRARGGGGGGAAASGLSNAGWATVVEGLKNGCASGMAAACAKLLLQPFDTVKTLQQANKGSLGMLEAAQDLVSRKGVSALYTGLGVTLVGSIPAVSVYFGVYQAVKKALLQALPPGLGWSLLGVAASAGVGNTVASIFRVPYEVVKQRLQAGMYVSTGQALRTMYRTEGGLLAFFGTSGVASQILRDVPYAIVTLLTYESMRRTRAERRLGPGESKGGLAKGSTALEDSVMGALAGGVGSLVSNPMDVVKTRVMTQPGLYPTVWSAVSKVSVEEGPSAFFKGTVPRLLHKVPANAIFFATYEIFRGLLRVQG